MWNLKHANIYSEQLSNFIFHLKNLVVGGFEILNPFSMRIYPITYRRTLEIMRHSLYQNCTQFPVHRKEIWIHFKKWTSAVAAILYRLIFLNIVCCLCISMPLNLILFPFAIHIPYPTYLIQIPTK